MDGKNMNTIILILLFISIFAQSFAANSDGHQKSSSQLNTSGHITADTEWSADTVYVTGDILIEDPYTLAIQAGVRVLFEGHFKIEVEGRFLAKGEPENPIYFTASDSSVGWHGVRFENVISADSSIIEHCVFEHGKADIISGMDAYGGAVFVQSFSSLVIRHSEFRYNFAAEKGGAIACLGPSEIELSHNRFTKNSALTSGGAIYTHLASIKSDANLIARNHAGHGGGGIAFEGASEATMTNLTIIENTSENYGGGIYCDEASIPTFNNCIIWQNSAVLKGNQLYFHDDGSDPVVRFCLVEGDLTEIGLGSSAIFEGEYHENLAQDPQLMPHPSYKLKHNSPCIDSGNPASAVPAGGGLRADIGAFEYTGTIVTRKIEGPGKYTFGPTRVALEFYETTIDSFTIERSDNGHPLMLPVMMDRYFTLSTKSTNFLCKLEYRFDPSDSLRFENNEKLSFYRLEDPDWFEEGGVYTGTSVYLDSCNLSGTFTIGEPVPPSAPVLASAIPDLQKEAVILEWPANKENDIAGYIVSQASVNNVSSAKQIGKTGPSAIEFEDVSFVNGEQNYYWLNAFDKAGNISEPSSAAEVLPVFGLKRDSLALLSIYDNTGGPGWEPGVNWFGTNMSDWSNIVISEGRVRELDLSGQNLLGLLPADILKLDSLRSINLSSNKLDGVIPDSLVALRSIESIDISNNNFSGPVPSSLIYMNRLKLIRLADNNFIRMPDISGNRGIQELDIRNNRLRFIDILPHLSVPVFDYAPQKPYGLSESIELNYGQNLRINRNAGGTNTTYRWYHDNILVTPGDSVFEIKQATSSDNGEYYCEAENDLLPDLVLQSAPARVSVDLPPAPPSNLSGLAGDEEVFLSWQQNDESDLEQYNILRGLHSDMDSILYLESVKHGQTSFKDTSVINGLTYYYAVNAADSNGNTSGISNIIALRPDGPPEWKIDETVIMMEDEVLRLDLAPMIYDCDPDSSLKLEITDPGLFNVTKSANLELLISPPENYYGLSNLLLTVLDPSGHASATEIGIKVLPVNDAPVYSGILDTSVYTYIPFNYKLPLTDVDDDTLYFSDDFELGEVDAEGYLKFTAGLNDTGMHEMRIEVSDGDTIQPIDMKITINKNVVNAPYDLVAQSFDKAIELTWENPPNPFANGTRIELYEKNSITDGPALYKSLDTSLVKEGKVTIKIENLPIAKTYEVNVLHFFAADTVRIYSEKSKISASTCEPDVTFPLTSYLKGAVAGDTTLLEIPVKNEGPGTLMGRLISPEYAPDYSWCSIDTSLKTILPGKSDFLCVYLHPSLTIARDTLTLKVNFIGNDPDELLVPLELSMFPLFDEYAPRLVRIDGPDSLCTQAAVRFCFWADDTSGVPAGDVPEEITSRYICKDRKSDEVIFSGSGTGCDDAIIYPLDDGRYTFSLWLIDSKLNGQNPLQPVYQKTFVVNSGSKYVPSRRWILAGVPQASEYYPDDIFSKKEQCEIYRWNNDEKAYQPVNDSLVVPGTGYWIYAKHRGVARIERSASESVMDSVNIAIVKGWNQLTNPYPFQIAWKDAKLTVSGSMDETKLTEAAETSNGFLTDMVCWTSPDDVFQGYQWGTLDTTMAQPWTGYWLHSAVDGILTFPTEPAFSDPDAAQNTADSSLNKINEKDFRITFSVSSAGYRDQKNIAGFTSKPVQNIVEPPPIGEYCALYFGSADHKLTAEYKMNPGEIDEVTCWSMHLNTTHRNESHVITWSIEGVQDYYVYLVDQRTEEIIDMNTISEHWLTPATRERNFRVYVTRDADFKPIVVPEHFRLLQNYPNPFNPQTTIRFGIPENAGDQLTRLRVFNLLGQEVALLLDQVLEPGYHAVQWNGTNTSGHSVASGVYFFRLESSGQTLVRKMLLVR